MNGKLRDLVPLLASRGLEQKADYILLEYVALYYIEVRLGQLKWKM